MIEHLEETMSCTVVCYKTGCCSDRNVAIYDTFFQANF